MKRILQFALGAAILGLLAWVAQPQAILAAFSSLTISSITLLLAIAVLLVFISACKWKFFIEALGSEVSVWRLCNLYLLGYFVNTLLPSWIGGDVVRSWYIGKRIGQHDALAATILERFTGLVAMIVLAFTAMWFSPLVTWQIEVVVAVLLVALVGIAVVACSDRMLGLIGMLPGGALLRGHFVKIQSGLRLVQRRPTLLVKTMALSFLFHVGAIFNTAAAAWGVGWTTVPLVDLTVVVPLILIVGAIPVAPAGLGIQEGAFYFFLSGIGATPAQALSVGLVLRAKTYLLGLLGWFSWQYERRYNREFVASALQQAGISKEQLH